jgi:hypothetical protein
MITITITVERLNEIEQERNETTATPEFQEWFKQLNVSRLHVDKTGVMRAAEIMKQWSDNNTKRGSYF